MAISEPKQVVLSQNVSVCITKCQLKTDLVMVCFGSEIAILINNKSYIIVIYTNCLYTDIYKYMI